MRICDKCVKPTQASEEFHVITDDTWYDLCPKHRLELDKFMMEKDKKPRARQKAKK